MWTHADVERLLAVDSGHSVLSGATAGGEDSSRRPGIGTRALLRVTTSRFHPAKHLPTRHLPLFVELQEYGWTFREACPRYYLCWRNSALMQKSRSPIAIFPRAATDLATTQRSVFLIFELLRRVFRVRLINDGEPAWAADSAEATAALTGVVAERVFGDSAAADRCANLVCDAELTILESAVRWPVRKTAAAAAFLPRHLSRW